MGFFRKKKESKGLKLPELPPAPAFPELPNERKEIPSLPQLKPLPQLPQLPQLPPLKKLPQIQSSIPKEGLLKPMKPLALEVNAERKAPEGPIFVKIDKFKEAMNHFEFIKKKLNESFNLLEDIKETRAKEEEELNKWSDELTSLKEKIAQIDKKIFSSLE